jgi:hypothetical protein
MTIELNPRQERLLHQAMQQRQFRTVDEALDAALSLISTPTAETAAPAPSPQARAATVARMLERRKGRQLREGVTIEDVIAWGREGRA